MELKYVFQVSTYKVGVQAPTIGNGELVKKSGGDERLLTNLLNISQGPVTVFTADSMWLPKTGPFSYYDTQML